MLALSPVAALTIAVRVGGGGLLKLVALTANSHGFRGGMKTG